MTWDAHTDRVQPVLHTDMCTSSQSGLHSGGGGGGGTSPIFGSRGWHANKIWTQSDQRFCVRSKINEKYLKSMKKGVNWIENQGEN